MHNCSFLCCYVIYKSLLATLVLAQSAIGSVSHELIGKRVSGRLLLRTQAVAIGWPVQPDVAFPLLLACQSRHIAVVIAIIDSPVPLVQPLLLLPDGLQILLGLFLADAVDGNEMTHQLLMPRSVVAKQDMFGIVAVFAQCRKALQPLAGCLFIVLPDFVTVQHAFPAAYLATVSGTLVN